MSLDKDYSKCMENKIGKFSIKEKKATLHINSIKTIQKYIVDGCLITGTSAKCDYLLLNKDDSTANFVELKGEDAIHACEQIKGTLEKFQEKEFFKDTFLSQNLIMGYVVSPHCQVPDIKSSHRKEVCTKLRTLSKKKLDLFDHLLFIKCKKDNSNDSPLNI